MAEGSDHQHAGTAAGSTQLRTVLLCDLADSTALVERLGDQRGAGLIRSHDRVARDLLREHGGREIDKTDGFLALFDRPIQAVAFALDYQRALKTLTGLPPDVELRARVGIHVGEVRVWDNAAEDVAQGAKPVEVEGLAKPVAARLMGLALPGQVLLSGVAHSLALRAQDELGDKARRVRWLTHGRYRFKGVPQPMVVHEVGEPSVAPLKPPPSGSKVRRELPWYRTPLVLGVELLVALSVTAAMLWGVLRPDPAIAFAERDWVVVGDLRNLTAEPLFDDALDTAFRIGLEQSRYVNVVPNLQVRDALRRMERDPGAPLDRDTALELALREGARAVVLPTVTEVAGRVRVSVEVVDPASGVTVYGESADGRGAGAALPAMDEVLESVRSRLGESLASIEASSAPLEKVTTANLEALRAFSLGIRAAESGRASEAFTLFERAIELDPQFAAAHAKIAGYYYQAGDRARAWTHIRAAGSARERLSARDQLYVDAYLAFFETPEAMYERWLQLAQLYPDFIAGQQNVGMVLWMHQNDFAAALPWFERVAESRHPFRGIGMDAAAAMLLAIGERDRARQRAEDARKVGAPQIFYTDIDMALSARSYDEVDAILARPLDARFATARLARGLREAAMLVDRGRLAAALSVLRSLSDGARADALPDADVRARLAIASVLAWNGDDAAKEVLAALVADESARLAKADETRNTLPADHLLLAAALAASAGHDALARQAIDAAGAHARGSGYWSRDAALAVAEAELARMDGDPATALERLEPLFDGREPVMAHAAAMRAARAAGDTQRALRHARWLVEQRGRGLAEYLYFHAMLPANVIAANDAQLLMAELQAGDAERAREVLEPLLAAWADADAGTVPQRRLATLRKRLSLDQEDREASLPGQL